MHAAGPARAAAAPPATKRRRRRRRALVRNVEDSRLYNLVLDVNALRSEVQRLELDREVFATRALVARQNRLDALLAASSRVFRVFRHGYRPSQWRASHEAFVRGVFHDRVAVSEHVSGQEGLLEQWRLYTELFRMGVFGVSSLQVVMAETDESGFVIEALGEFDGRITPAALHVVFPHVVGDRALEEMLLGRPFVCPTRTLLHFDRSGRITRFEANADMVTAVSQLVGSSPELVAALMAHARINDASLIEIVGEQEEDRDGAQSQEDSAPTEHEAIEVAAIKADCDRPEAVSWPLVEPVRACPSNKTDEDAVQDVTNHRQSVAFILS